MKAKPEVHAVIMAGGSGTRFWPLSRRRTPKQFLPIVSDRTMVEETVRRIRPVVPNERVYTIANGAQTRALRRLLPGVPSRNLLVEPKSKNTAPSLILATARIYLDNPEGVVAVLPSDHLIADTKTFLKKLGAAAAAAREENALVMFGIPPTFPSTGYGYIHFRKRPVRTYARESFFDVAEFKEKPTYETAEKFVRSGEYFWNSGMFIWRASVFAEKMERFAPEFFPFWRRILDALRTKSRAKLASAFADIPALSIDYALMEKAGGVLVNEGRFGWSDVGAWSSLAEIWEKDGAGNAVKGEAVFLNSRNVLCYNPGKLTALVGLQDLIVVNTKDSLLVCRMDQDQKVKEVLEILRKAGKPEYL